MNQGVRGDRIMRDWSPEVTAVYRPLQWEKACPRDAPDCSIVWVLGSIIVFSMKRQICSYDMVAVPSSSYTVTDAEGDMYLCNSRCLCIWAVMLVTKHNLPESERDRSFVITNPVGKRRSFDKLIDLAQWAAANALGKPESEWLMNGRDVE
jgi:hypothetical protein